MLISGGELAPLQLSDASPMYVNAQYYPSAGLNLSNAFSTYGQVYKSQVWVSTLVNKIAFGVARLPLKVYARSADNTRSEARDAPMAKLLRNPNSRHDPFFFWLWTVSTFEIYGEAMWVKVRPRPGAAPTQLWPLHPSNVITKRDRETGRLVYEYYLGAANAPVMEWDEADVVHFKGYNPENQVRGMSRLEPLRQTILNEDAARRASAAFWSNGGRPSMAVTVPGSLSQPAVDRLGASLRGLHSGVDNWGKIAVLEEGATPTLLPLNAEEMQYIESRRINREEACGIYDVPPPVVHILDRATFSNITEQMRSMYRDTMAPRLGLFESVLDTQLRPDFDPQGNLYAEFLMDEVLRGAFEERAVANQSAINSGQRTPNEIRRLDNLPPLDGGDQLYINAASVPLSVASAGPVDGTDVVAHPQAIKSLSAESVGRLMGRLGRVKSLSDLDREALVAGLPDAGVVLGLLDAAQVAGATVRSFRETLKEAQGPSVAPDAMTELVKALTQRESPTIHVHPPAVTVGDVVLNAAESGATRVVRTVERDENGLITRTIEES